MATKVARGTTVFFFFVCLFLFVYKNKNGVYILPLHEQVSLIYIFFFEGGFFTRLEINFVFNEL